MTAVDQHDISPGHVFVVHSDLTSLKCDDVLVPTDSALNVTPGFRDLLGDASPIANGWARDSSAPPVPDDWAEPGRRPLLLPGGDGQRRVWLINTADASGDLEWLLQGISSALEWVAQQKRVTARARPLIAMPLFGVGDGGFAAQRAEVISGVLDVLHTSVQRDNAPDVALTLFHRSDYAVIQTRRQERDFPKSVLRHQRAARAIAAKAESGDLVLFLGAGVSIAAGLPSWAELLQRLGQPWFSPDELAAVMKLPAPDVATVIERRLPAGALAGTLSKLLPPGPHALAHALLASMRVPEAITTNYDSMYEQAAEVPFGQPVAVLPRERATSSRPWVLKLHGDLHDSGSIVLTRDHYLRFAADRAPLAAVVQSRLLTSHVLFVGYSLIDDNFVRLAQEVRQLFTTAVQRSEPLGTVLTLIRDTAREQLWEGDLTYVAMSEDGSGSVQDAARTLEILLDYTAWQATDEPSFLLDCKYRSLLGPGDQQLAEALDHLNGQAKASDNGSPYWPRVHALLKEFGAE